MTGISSSFGSGTLLVSRLPRESGFGNPSKEPGVSLANWVCVLEDS